MRWSSKYEIRSLTPFLGNLAENIAEALVDCRPFIDAKRGQRFGASSQVRIKIRIGPSERSSAMEEEE